MYRFDGARPSIPYRLHHFVFEVRKRRPNRGPGCCTQCHGTLCTSQREPPSRTFCDFRTTDSEKTAQIQDVREVLVNCLNGVTSVNARSRQLEWHCGLSQSDSPA